MTDQVALQSVPLSNDQLVLKEAVNTLADLPTDDPDFTVRQVKSPTGSGFDVVTDNAPTPSYVKINGIWCPMLPVESFCG